MKIPVLLLTLGMLTSSLVTGIAAPLLHYKFDQAGAVQQSSGSSSLSITQLSSGNVATDYIAAAPVQRSGASNSLALNFTSDNVNAGAAQTVINSTSAPFLREGLGSFTISAWVLDVTAGQDRRIFTLRDTNPTAKSIIDFRLASDNTLILGLSGSKTVEGTEVIATASFYNTAVKVANSETKWHFVALSYDAETGNIVFYSGAEGGTLVSGAAVNTTGALLHTGTVLAIGNVGYEHARRLDGYLSDVQYHDTALSAGEMGAIFTAVPEPGVSMLLGASVILMGVHSFKFLKR